MGAGNREGRGGLGEGPGEDVFVRVREGCVGRGDEVVDYPTSREDVGSFPHQVVMPYIYLLKQKASSIYRANDS